MSQPARPGTGFDTSDGELLVGGIPLRRLAERVGSTPFFAYDRALLDARVASLRAALPGDIELSYAVKANPCRPWCSTSAAPSTRSTWPPGAEMRVALDTPIRPAAISFAGPGKSVGELTQAVAAGVLIELESPLEADRVTDIGERLGVRPHVAIRVNPDFEVKGSGMRMGGGAQQFGVDAEDVPALARSSVAGVSTWWGSTSSPARRTCTPRSSARRRRTPWTWCCAWPSTCRRRSATSTSAAVSASPTTTRTSPSTCRWSGTTSTS